MRTGPSFKVRRSSSIWASIAGEVWWGQDWGLLGAVHQADRSEFVPAVPPLVSRGAGDPHFGGHVGYRST